VGELKHLSTPRTREDSRSSGERNGRSPNPTGGTGCRRCSWGVGRSGRRGGRPATESTNPRLSRTLLEGATGAGESPVGDRVGALVGCVSTAGHVESRGKLGGPPSKAKYSRRPIADEYREGPVKSTPARGVKENLKPCASRLSERASVMACLLENEPASDRLWRGEGSDTRSRSESESEAGVGGNPCESRAVDPKPGELPMTRLKRG
jgi:hypothetical protein